MAEAFLRSINWTEDISTSNWKKADFIENAIFKKQLQLCITAEEKSMKLQETLFNVFFQQFQAKGGKIVPFSTWFNLVT